MSPPTVSASRGMPIYKRRPPRTLIPILPTADNVTLLTLAHWLAASEPVLLLGIVPVPEGENLSIGAGPARELRNLMNEHVDRVSLRAKPRVRVTYTPWDDIRVALVKDPSIDLLVLNWPAHLQELNVTAAELLSRPPCDIAIVRGPLPEEPHHFYVPMRGGPHAERALRLALALGRPYAAQTTTLRLCRPTQEQTPIDDFAGMAQILAELPDVVQEQVVTDAAGEIDAVLQMGGESDVLVLGTAARPTSTTSSFGRITDAALTQSPSAVIAVKTKRVVPEGGRRFSTQAISVLVDRWFAESTFHADEFADLSSLMQLKEEHGYTISVALPALNEEDTVGDIIGAIQRAFMTHVSLVDELVLMDSYSSDQTREIASRMGVPVYIHQEVLPEYGARAGKGEALWKSLFVTSGDIVIWVDTDVENFHPRFVYGLLGPLLHRTSLRFIKGFYRRPLKTGQELRAGRGGRVTELTARPLLNLFYPELSGIVQPLAGEYGGRRSALEQLTFASGYGVEIALLIDAFEKFKLASIAQVDLEERIHRNQPLARLSRMSFAIIQALFSKLERRYGREMLMDINRSMKSIRYEPGYFFLDVEDIAELERPPMVEVPAYRKKWGLPEISE